MPEKFFARKIKKPFERKTKEELPERLARGDLVCPQCKKPSLKYVQDAKKFVCTNCGFEAGIKHAG